LPGFPPHLNYFLKTSDSFDLKISEHYSRAISLCKNVFDKKDSLKKTVSLFSGTVFLFVVTPRLDAQVYPVQVTTQLTPPYSLFLSDYVSPGSERLAVHILLRELSRPELNVRLRLKIIGQGITIETKPEFLN
jgi:hypothetical protein